jgi:SynChlorMet cassette protein ScmC
MPDPENRAKGLHLKLANGQEWALVARDPCRQWLLRFGRALQLESREIDGLPKLIFVPGNLHIDWRKVAGEGFGTNIPRLGWTCHDLGVMRSWSHPLAQDVVCELELNDSDDIDVLRMWLSVDVVYAKAVSSGGLPLHGGLVARNGCGVLLAGTGGAGKSTCCSRIPAPWESLCDDEVLVVADASGEFRVHPFPTWSDYLWRGTGKTWDVQHHLPIEGIFFVKQAEQDRVRPLGRGEAAALINGSAEQVVSRYLRGLSEKESAAFRRQVFANACELAQKVPAFALSVALNGEFWVEIEKVIEL